MGKIKNEGEAEVEAQVALDEDNRRLYFFGEVTESKSMQFLLFLQTLDQTEGDIQVVLNSLGGDTHAGYCMYDAMRLCKNEVVVSVYGNCYSIATLLVQGGSRRLAAPNAEFMIHDIAAEVHGHMKPLEVKDLTRALNSDRNRYVKLMLQGTNLTKKKLLAMMNKEVYFTADEAIKMGVIDSIITKPTKGE